MSEPTAGDNDPFEMVVPPAAIRQRLARAELAAVGDLVEHRPGATVGAPELLRQWSVLTARLVDHRIQESEWAKVLQPRNRLHWILGAAETHGSLAVISWLLPLVDAVDSEFRDATVESRSGPWSSWAATPAMWWNRRALAGAQQSPMPAPFGYLHPPRVFADCLETQDPSAPFLEVPMGADLTGHNLAGENLAGMQLQNTNLSGVDLGSADLTRADLTGANLTGANLAGANLTLTTCDRIRASGAVLMGGSAQGASFKEANLQAADMRAIIAHSAMLRSADLREAQLDDAVLAGADLSWAQLDDARCTGADFSRSLLANATFSRADTKNANFTGARTKGHLGSFDTLPAQINGLDR